MKKRNISAARAGPTIPSKNTKSPSHDLRTGDCLQVLKDLPSESVDLICTSPPYGQARKKTYGGIDPDQYVQWFLPIADQLFRVLRNSGRFILNIKECVVDGGRHPYVYELVLALRDRGWRWTEEYIWHKKNGMPGKPVNRFQDRWEHLYHFTKQPDFKWYPDAVKVPASPATIRRAQHLRVNDRQLRRSGTGRPFRRCVAKCVGRLWVYPSNVLHLAAQTRNVGHSAALPESLPTPFIKLQTVEDDVVLDPFCGSGTTGVAARRLGRRFAGIDMHGRNIKLSRKRIREVERDGRQRSMRPPTPLRSSLHFRPPSDQRSADPTVRWGNDQSL